MAASSRRTVISGLGVLNAIGRDTASYWESLCQGRSGVRVITTFDPSGLPVRFAGEVSDFDPKDFIPKEPKEHRKALRVMARTIQFAVSAVQLALTDGAVDRTKLDPDRFGVSFGCGLIATELLEMAEASVVSANCQPNVVDMGKWAAQGLPAIPPLWMLKYLPNMLACQVSIFHDVRGPNNSITQSDVAGLLALGEAHRILCRGGADFFLVGGAESKINALSMVRQCLFEPLSRRNEEPAQACRPFDKKRDGLVLGEGGAVLVVEELEHARKRNARILAEVVGFGAAFDRRRDGAGLARAVRQALTEADITPAEVDHVNAHGLGSVTADVWEARGLREAFGTDGPPVFAAKGYFGNLGAGGGPSELAASILALQHGLTPATLNYDEPDPTCPISVIAREPRPVTKPYVVKVGFTPMGQCAATVIRKFSDH